MKTLEPQRTTPAQRTTGGLAGRGEARFRTILLSAGMVVGPLVLLVLYYKARFSGIVNNETLDFAQLGRNLQSGHGFSTFFLRPLALTHGSDPLHQPDLVHGPLYPLALAIAFGILGTADNVVAHVSTLFYLLTIPAIYLLGRKLFNPTIGLVSALIFTCNSLMLEYAISGLHITLYLFLMTCLLLVMYDLAVRDPGQAPERAPRPQKGKLLLAGALTSLLYLTDPIFFWVMPVVLGAVLWLNWRNRGQAALWFCLPLLLLCGPWMLRNTLLSGNPIFGLRGAEVWMFTKSYPGLDAYRTVPADLTPSQSLFHDVLNKVVLGIGRVIPSFPEITASWVLAFFLPSLLFRFKGGAANRLRWVLVGSFAALLLGMLFFYVEMPLFAAFIPGMLVFSVGYLLVMIEQGQLTRGARGTVASLVAMVALFPVICDMTLVDRTPALKEVALTQGLKKEVGPDEVVLSDQPWLVAWYANRPSIWIPASDSRINDLRVQFKGMRWLFMTDKTRGFSKEWQSIYQAFWTWNAKYVVAYKSNQDHPGSTSLPGIMRIDGKQLLQKAPTEPVAVLADALDGFVSVQPLLDEKNPQMPSVLVAVLPSQKISSR